LGQFNPTTLPMLWISSFYSFYVCEFALNVSVFFIKIRFLKTICETKPSLNFLFISERFIKLSLWIKKKVHIHKHLGKKVIIFFHNTLFNVFSIHITTGRNFWLGYASTSDFMYTYNVCIFTFLHVTEQTKLPDLLSKLSC
jgi:hypothetical protein